MVRKLFNSTRFVLLGVAVTGAYAARTLWVAHKLRFEEVDSIQQAYGALLLCAVVSMASYYWIEHYRQTRK